MHSTNCAAQSRCKVWRSWPGHTAVRPFVKHERSSLEMCEWLARGSWNIFGNRNSGLAKELQQAAFEALIRGGVAKKLCYIPVAFGLDFESPSLPLPESAVFTFDNIKSKIPFDGSCDRIVHDRGSYFGFQQLTMMDCAPPSIPFDSFVGGFITDSVSRQAVRGCPYVMLSLDRCADVGMNGRARWQQNQELFFVQLER